MSVVGGTVESAGPVASGLVSLHGYRNDVQVLRGLAVLLVVLYHARLISGGFVGVDVFFVISGFVIGRGLVGQLTGSGTVSLRGFYIRRARRLLMALAVMLSIVLLLTPLFAPVSAVRATIRTGIAAALFNANTYLYVAGGQGYFTPAAELNPLLHTWSLSVEEQFYFVIPALVLLAWRLGTRRWHGLSVLRVLVVSMTVVSVVLCLWMSFSSSVGPLAGLRFAFFSPLTRAWEFAIGLGLVLIPSRWFPRHRGAVVMWGTGLGFVIIAAALYSDSTTFPGIAAALPVMGAAFMISGATHLADTTATGPLAAPLLWLGDRSYSWYLWHWPLIVFMSAFWPNAGRWPLVLAAGLSLLPASASYRFAERGLPIRVPQRTRPTLAFAAACIAAPLVASVLAHVSLGPVEHIPGAERLTDARRFHLDYEAGCDDSTPILERDPEQRSACTFGTPESTRDVLLVGDSNAGQLTEGLILAAKANKARLEIATMSGCRTATIATRPVPDPRYNPRTDARCATFLQGIPQQLQAEHPDLVILAFSTNWAIAGTDGEPDAQLRGAAGEGLVHLVDEMRSSGTSVVVVRTLPKPGSENEYGDTGRCSQIVSILQPESCASPAFSVNREDLRVAHEVEDASVSTTDAIPWDLGPTVCPNGECSGMQEGRYVFRDGGHISVGSSQQLSPTLTQFLATALGSAGPGE